MSYGVYIQGICPMGYIFRGYVLWGIYSGVNVLWGIYSGVNVLGVYIQGLMS